MKPAAVGSRIRVVGQSNEHNYEVGQIYTVAMVDTDGTFKATDASGKLGNWLRWTDCEPAGEIGWKFCQEVLPPEVIEFLEAFDGVEALALKDAVKDEILKGLPNLQEEILAAARKLRATAAAAAQAAGEGGADPKDGGGDPDDDDLFS
jgi:hypothetical protein